MFHAVVCRCRDKAAQRETEPRIFMKNVFIVEGGDALYHFKTLVPAVAAGAIIGKGGETIAAIQKDTGARVKMSKSHDFYPGK